MLLFLMVIVNILPQMFSYRLANVVNKSYKLRFFHRNACTIEYRYSDVSSNKNKVIYENKRKYTNDEEKLSNVVSGIIGNESGSCLFSTISNKTVVLKSSSPNYPISFVLNYNLDFDGKPFFRLKIDNDLSFFQYSLMSKSPSSSINIYSMDSNKPSIENLIVFGKTVESKDIINNDRFEWIIENNRAEDLYLNDGVYDYRYFKMEKVDQIELVRSDGTNSINPENSLLSFIKPENYLDSFNVYSDDVIEFIQDKYKDNIIKDLKLSHKIEEINFINIKNVDSYGINLFVSYNLDMNQMYLNKDIKINFSKRIKNFKELYEELISLKSNNLV